MHFTQLKNMRPISAQYKQKIKRLYNVDIDKDSPYVHPKKLCPSCRYQLGNVKEGKYPDLGDIDVHSDSCELRYKGKGRQVKGEPKKIDSTDKPNRQLLLHLIL